MVFEAESEISDTFLAEQTLDNNNYCSSLGNVPNIWMLK